MTERTRGFADRLQRMRREFYGEDLARVAQEVGVPVRTWENYEAGVVMPAIVMLRFLDATQASPRALMDDPPPSKANAAPRKARG